MSNNKYKILIVEDEINIRSMLETLLASNGYQTVGVGSCAMGLAMIRSHHPDLMLLDLGLPDGDGLDIIAQVRKDNPLPIIVLSARSRESDKVSALDLGANDYVTKPFGAQELLARIRATLRNRQYDIPQVPRDALVAGEMSIDYLRRQVTLAGKSVPLTQTEFNILAFLSKYPDRVLTYATIIQAVWGSADGGGIKKLQVNVANIRKKMGLIPGDDRYILNEMGVGYRFTEKVPVSPTP